MTPERSGRAPPELVRAAELLAGGEVVGLPTDTVYGLAVDPRREAAVEKLFTLKGRPESVALPVLIAEPGEAATLAVVDGRAEALADRYWPGPLTLVLRRRQGITLHLGGHPESVGIRCPALPVTRQLISITGPLAVTSANRHGGPPCRTAEEVRALFGADLELVVDGGRCDSEPSTVVSFLGAGGDGRAGVECLREGAIALAEIEQVVRGPGPGPRPGPDGDIRSGPAG